MTAIHIKAFCFNPFYENTYLIYNDAGVCWIVDPGCSNQEEQEKLSSFIREYELRPVKLLLTHGHIDHILGCAFVYHKFGLSPEMHLKELEIYNSGSYVGAMYGIEYIAGPPPGLFLVDGQTLLLGDSSLTCILCPGHSPGSICFYNKEQKFLIGGDVLFEGSIGRTDLPGGDHDSLIRNIKARIFSLDKNVVVYPGHGGATTVGQEILTNPFF
ncbi:MAG: MBL fold metallo-hydrolase [Saprospiraceae bacterium]|nr:MBL fold metallo-hydrolase [Saprospiraceae bacterium]